MVSEKIVATGNKIAFSELNERSIRELADESLLNEHRHVHGLAKLGQVECRELRRVHRILATEITRRGMEHDSLLECSEKAVSVERPHGFLIWKNKQSAVGSDESLPVNEPLLLVSGGEAFGHVTLSKPAQMTVSEFDRIEWADKHCVRPEERRMWWPDAEVLYVHEITAWKGFDKSLRCDFKEGQAAVKEYQPPTERERRIVEQSSKLPRQIILTPRAVSLTGSLLYGQHEPRDTDVVMVGAEWRPEEGQFVVPLSPSFKLKLERALKAVYETGNDVQYIAEGQGASFDHLPLYSLALVRLPRLEVEHVSESEPDFAALCYDKALSQSALDRKLRGASEKIKRQAKQTYDEDRIKPGRMVLSLKPLRPAPQGERQIVSHFYDYIQENLEFPLYISAKRDGATHYVHSDGQRVWFFSDDGEDNTDKLSTLVEAFKKTFDGKSYVMGVEVEKWIDGKHYPREAAIGDVKRGEDDDLAANIFRVVYWDGRDLHKEPFGEVWEKIVKDMPTDTRSDGALKPHEDGPVNVVPHYLVKNLDELRKQLERVAYQPGVEGVVVKRTDADFPLDGEADTEYPQEVKWHKSVSGILTITGKTETKTPSVYVYDLAIGDMEIGRTFGTKQDIVKGSPVEVEAEQVNLERDEDGKIIRVSFWAPDLIGKSERKPESLETITERARKHGVLREKVRKLGGEIEYLPNESGQPATAGKQVSFEPPKAVQQAAALGLELRRQFGRGGTQIGVARARDLSNGRAVSLDTIQRMVSYFARHAVDAEASGWGDRENPSAGWVAWLLWGGNPGREWAERILAQSEKQRDILLRYPDEEKKQRFVFQNHFRGRSVHGDFRAQNDDYLVGWTIAHQQPGEIKEPVETIAAANRAEGESKNWKMDLKTGLIKPREIRGGTTRRGNLRAFPKATEIPEAWLNVEGVTEKPDPGEAVPVGATAEYPGVFIIVQKGTVEYGALKPDFKEYFIEGDSWPAQRWTFRLLERGKQADEMLPPGEEEEDAREPFYWILLQPVDQTPHILSQRAVEEDWLPPKGVSALPKAIRDKIPEELRYWETSGKKALEQRRRIVEELDVRELVGPDLKETSYVLSMHAWYCDECGKKIADIANPSPPEDDTKYLCLDCAGKQVGSWHDYVLQRRTWKGQTVIRFGPSTELWDLWVKGEGKPWHLVMQRDPRGSDPVVAYEDKETPLTFKDANDKEQNVFEIKETASIAPGEALNPTKDTPASIETVDTGKTRALDESPEFIKVEFKEGRLKGAFVFEREEAGSDIGQFVSSGGPETKETEMYIYDCEVCGKEFESQEPVSVCVDCQGTKAGRRLGGEKLGTLREITDAINDALRRLGKFLSWAAYEDEDPFSLTDLFNDAPSGMMMKEVNGEPWHFTWSANAFKDREGEIFSTAALEEFVREVAKREDKGYFNFWHIPGTDFAEKRFIETVGRFLVEAGPYLNDEKGRRAKEFFKKHRDGHPEFAPEGWGASVEYRYLPEDKKSRVYKWVWFPRTSTLPRAAAANIWNQTSQEVTVTTLTGAQQKAAEALFGKDFVEKLIEDGEKKTAELEQQVEFKGKDGETETGEKQVRKFTSALREIADMVEDEGIKKQLEGVADGLTMANMEERAGVVRMVAGRLDAGDEKTRLQAIAAAMAGGEEYPAPQARREAEEGEGEGQKEAGSEEAPELTPESIALALKEIMEVDLDPVTQAILKTDEHVGELAESVKALATRVERLEKDEALKSKTDLPRLVLSLQKKASEAEETVVDDEDDLKEKKPKETEKAGDGSVASHYFGQK